MTTCETCPFALTGECHFTYHFGTLYCTREALEGKEVPEVATVTFTWVESAPIAK